MSDTVIKITPSGKNSDSSYQITVGRGLLKRLQALCPLEKYSRIFVLSDTEVWSHWGEHVREGLGKAFSSLLFPPGEGVKTLENAEKACQFLIEHGADRKSLIINVGGGAIGDFGGFVASIFMRGIDFVQVPTTLLSQVDASVGGKVAVNLGGMKNIVGSFHQPKAVLVDTEVLTTLPERELRSGLAEVIKHGFIADRNYLESVRQVSLLEFRTEKSQEVIEGSIRIKAAVVEDDPFENGRRKILNFGHTAGHAFESLSHREGSPWKEGALLHGEAVVLGMVLALRLSVEMKKIETQVLERALEIFRQYGFECSLPSGFDLEMATDIIRADKKNVAGRVHWILLRDLGDAEFDCAVPKDILERCLLRMKES